MGNTSFRPTSHGWPFTNSFDGGLCGGMCWAALDRYYAGTFIPGDTPLPPGGDPLYGEIRQRQADSLPPAIVLKFYEWQSCRPDTGSSTNPYHSIGHLVQTEEWPAARAELDANRPVTLGLVRVDSANPSSTTDNHQVLAYRYELDPGGVVKIWVYDPNHPNDDSVYLQITLGQENSRLDALQSTSERLRGFFVIPYDRAATDRRLQDCWFNHMVYSRVVNKEGIRLYEYLVGLAWRGNVCVDYSVLFISDHFPAERCLLSVDGAAYDRLRCPEFTGSRDAPVAVNQNYGSWFDVRVYLQDRLLHSQRLVLPKPYVFSLPYLHEVPLYGGATDQGWGIRDAQQGDVAVVKEAASDQEVQAYGARMVEVEGPPIYDGCQSGEAGLVPAGLRVDYQLGYVTAAVYCAIHEGYLDGARVLDYLLTNRRAQDTSGATTQGQIGAQQHDRFPVCGGFTRADYDGDRAMELRVSAREYGAEMANDTDVFYGKSLLAVRRMVISRFSDPGRFSGVKRRIHEYVDRQLLKDIIAELGPAPGPEPWPVGPKLRASVIAAAGSAWRQLQADKETIAGLAAIYGRELAAAVPGIGQTVRRAVRRTALRGADAAAIQRADELAVAYLRCNLVRRLLAAKALAGLARLKRSMKRMNQH